MIGSLSLELFSRFWIFFSLLLLKAFLEWDDKDKRRGRARVLLSLFVANKKYLWKYLTKGKKEEKKHPFIKEENILSLFSLFKGRQGFLSPPSSSSSSSAVFVKYRAAREERKQRAARGRKNPDIWWREEVLLGVLLIERSLCLRAFSPSNFPSEGIFIGLFFPTIFLLFGGKTALLKPSFSLWFFFLSFRKEGNEEEEKSTQKITTARVRRASTTLST